MKPKGPLAILLCIVLPGIQACATAQARQELEGFVEQGGLKNEAWGVARQRLQQMCPATPTAEEYQRGLAQRNAGADPFGGCDRRLVKLTNSEQLDDWVWVWGPPYRTIVGVHEEELRRRVVPRLYEEYMLAMARYLAEQIDRGAITDTQMVAAFNQSWAWMIERTRQEGFLLMDSLRAAQQADAATWNALGAVAAGLALVAGAALVASAPAYRPAPPRPVHCTMNPTGWMPMGRNWQPTGWVVNCF